MQLYDMYIYILNNSNVKGGAITRPTTINLVDISPDVFDYNIRQSNDYIASAIYYQIALDHQNLVDFIIKYIQLVEKSSDYTFANVSIQLQNILNILTGDINILVNKANVFDTIKSDEFIQFAGGE